MLRYSNIVFDPVGHTYTAPDGRALQGITGMLSKQLFPDEYAEVPKAILDNAAERGSNIHAQVEFCDDFGTTNDTPEVVNYQRLIKERELEPIESEYLVSDNEHFASSIDKVYKVSDTEYILGDIKTCRTRNVDKVRWQLSIYATLFERQNPGCKVVGLLAIWLRGEEAEITDINRIDDAVIDSLLAAEVEGRQFVNPLPSVNTLPDRYKAMEMQILDLLAKKKEIEEQVKTFSERMKGEMEKAGVKKWETDNMRLTYIDPTTKETFDSKRFKEENPESYKEYTKTTKVKSSIRITSL